MTRSCSRSRANARPIASAETTPSTWFRAAGSGCSASVAVPSLDRGRLDAHLAKAHPMAPRHARRVGDDPIQPAVERPLVPQAGRLAPGRDDRLLGRIGGIGLIAEDRIRQSVATVESRRDEAVERAGITERGAADKVVVRRADLLGYGDRSHGPPRRAMLPVDGPDAVASPEVCRGSDPCSRTSRGGARGPRGAGTTRPAMASAARWPRSDRPADRGTGCSRRR